MRFKSYTLKRKLTFILTSYSLVALILLFAVIFVFVQRQNIKTYQMNAYKKINPVAEHMNKELYTAVDKSNHIINNPMVLGGLKDTYEQDMEKIMQFYNMLNLYYSSFSPVEGGSDSSILIYTRKDIFPESKYTRKLNKFPDAEIRRKLDESKNTYIIWNSSVRVSASGVPYITFYRNIYNLNMHLGYLEMRVPIYLLTEYLKNVEFRNAEHIEFIDIRGEVIFTSAEGIPSKSPIVTETRLINDFKLRIVMSSAMLNRGYLFFGILFLLFFGLCLYLFFILSRNMVSSITEELYCFLDDIKGSKEWKSQGNSSETDIIKQKFRELILNERQMHENIMEMSRMKKSLELEVLQARINPHLLYNSLSLIKWRFLHYGDTNLTELIDSMTSYYKIILNNGNTIIKIKKEVEMIREFVRISELSGCCRYELVEEIDENLLECFTIKLLLQPIVENAIVHGLSDRSEAKIFLRLEERDGDIFIEVEDNGYGMTKETIDVLLNMTYESQGKSYGIKNVIKRIKTYYGEDYGINIQSEREKGTKVTVKIAKLTEEELLNRFCF